MQIVAFGVILSLTFSSSRGNADGCFFYDVQKLGNAAESPNQRALIIHGGESETLILQVKYSGTAEDFAWVVPLPDLPAESGITTESDSIFVKLHEMTQPRLFVRPAKSLDNRYYGGGGDPSFQEVTVPGVQIWEEITAGPYEVTILTGSSSLALLDYLQSNGLDLPAGADATVDFYIQKGWYFAAIKVHLAQTAQTTNASYQAGLPAIKMAFPTDKPVFPLRISNLTSAEDNEIELYVVASHRMACEGYHTVSMDRDEVQMLIEEQLRGARLNASRGLACACERIAGPDDLSDQIDYERIFAGKVRSSARPAFFVEYASEGYVSPDPLQYPKYGTLDGYFNEYFPADTGFWITRLRTLFSPDDMYDDIVFIQDELGDQALHLNIFVDNLEYENPWTPPLWGAMALVVSPVFAVKRMRRKYGRQAVLTLLIFVIALV